MLSKIVANEIINVTLDWKQFYINFRDQFEGSTKWQFPNWIGHDGQKVDLDVPNSYVKLYRESLARGATLALSEYSELSNERFINLMTRGDCGVTALALGIALSKRGIDVKYALPKSESHGFLVVEGHVVDVTGFHALSTVEPLKEYASHQFLPMYEFADYWMPCDYIGWLYLRHWATRYDWDFERLTLINRDIPNECMTPPQIHLGGQTLNDIDRLNRAGEKARRLPFPRDEKEIPDQNLLPLEDIVNGKVLYSRRNYQVAVVARGADGLDCSKEMVVYTNLVATFDSPPGRYWVLDLQSFRERFTVDPKPTPETLLGE